MSYVNGPIVVNVIVTGVYYYYLIIIILTTVKERFNLLDCDSSKYQGSYE